MKTVKDYFDPSLWYMKNDPDLTLDKFAEWLGVSSFQLETMDQVTLESLPKIAELHLIPLGGGRRLGKVSFKYEVDKDSTNLRRGEVFIGTGGGNYHESAKLAIAVVFEMITRRKRV